jgi:hypothetical protein
LCHGDFAFFSSFASGDIRECNTKHDYRLGVTGDLLCVLTKQ